jgi:hypothetical protein
MYEASKDGGGAAATPQDAGAGDGKTAEAGKAAAGAATGAADGGKAGEGAGDAGKAAASSVDAGKKEGEAAAKVVPDKYDLKLTDGSPLDPEVLNRISAYAKKEGLSNEEAQELLGDHEAQIKLFREEQTEIWHKKIVADPEFGGEKLKENAELSRRGLELIDPDGELQKELKRTGFGNFPPLFKAMVRLGRQSANDKAKNPSGASGETFTEPADRIYGKK